MTPFGWTEQIVGDLEGDRYILWTTELTHERIECYLDGGVYIVGWVSITVLRVFIVRAQEWLLAQKKGQT